MILPGGKLRMTEGNGFAHWCPGCKCMHEFPAKNKFTPAGRGWTYNYNPFLPTFFPSMRIFVNVPIDWNNEDGPKRQETLCHYMLTDGMLMFLADSAHSLAGKTVPLPALDGPERV